MPRRYLPNIARTGVAMTEKTLDITQPASEKTRPNSRGDYVTSNRMDCGHLSLSLLMRQCGEYSGSKDPPHLVTDRNDLLSMQRPTTLRPPSDHPPIHRTADVRPATRPSAVVCARNREADLTRGPVASSTHGREWRVGSCSSSRRRKPRPNSARSSEDGRGPDRAPDGVWLPDAAGILVVL